MQQNTRLYTTNKKGKTDKLRRTKRSRDKLAEVPSSSHDAHKAPRLEGASWQQKSGARTTLRKGTADAFSVTREQVSPRKAKGGDKRPRIDNTVTTTTTGLHALATAQRLGANSDKKRRKNRKHGTTYFETGQATAGKGKGRAPLHLEGGEAMSHLAIVMHHGAAEQNDREVHKMLGALHQHKLKKTPYPPELRSLAQAVRVITALKKANEGWGPDRSGIRNYNLANPMAKGSTYRGVSDVIAGIYLVFSCPTATHPGMMYVGQSWWIRKRFETRNLAYSNQPDREGDAAEDFGSATTVPNFALAEWRERGQRFYTVTLLELEVTAAVLKGGRGLRDIMQQDKPTLTRPEITAFRNFAGKLERFCIAQMGTSGKPFEERLGHTDRRPSNPEGGNVAGHRERGSKANRRSRRRTQSAVMTATPTTATTHPGVKLAIQLFEHPDARFKLQHGPKGWQWTTKASWHGTAPGAPSAFKVLKEMSQKDRRLIRGALQQVGDQDWRHDIQLVPTSQTLTSTVVPPSLNARAGVNACIRCIEAGKAGLTNIPACMLDDEPPSFIIPFVSMSLNSLRPASFQSMFEKVCKDMGASVRPGLQRPKIMFRSSTKLSRNLDNQGVMLGRLRKPPGKLPSCCCKSVDREYCTQHAATPGQWHLATSDMTAIPQITGTRQDKAGTQELQSRMREGRGLRLTDPPQSPEHLPTMIQEASRKYRARAFYAEEIEEDSWGDLGGTAFDVAVTEALMASLPGAPCPTSAPSLSKAAAARAKELSKVAVITASEKDTAFGLLCPLLAHQVIMTQELNTPSYKKIGAKGSPEVAAQLGKMQSELDRLSVVTAYGRERTATIIRRKKNQAMLEGKELPASTGAPLNRLPTMYGSVKQKMRYPPGTAPHGPPPEEGIKAGTVITALRPITAACDSMLTPLMDLMLAIDKLLVTEIKALVFELFTKLPADVALRYTAQEKKQLSDMAFPLPVLEGADAYAEFIERFNRVRLSHIQQDSRPKIDISTYDVVNCYPSTDTADAVERRKEITKAIKKRRKERHGTGNGNPPIHIDVGLDKLGEYVASFTAEKPNDKKSQRRSIVSLEQALRIFEFLMGNSPFEFYNDVWSQVLGYQQGAPQSAIEVNWFVLGWDEYIYMLQLRDRKELQLLKLFAGICRYLDDLNCIGDPDFEAKRYRNSTFKSKYTGATLNGVYRTGTVRPFTLQKEQENYPPREGRQVKVAFLDFAVYQDPITGLIAFHLYDKRFALKHDCHPVLRLPSTFSFMWRQAVTGTLQGELNRANGRTDRLCFFTPTAALMAYEDLRRGVAWTQVERLLRSYWTAHRPFHPDGYGDPATGAGDFSVFKNDILDLLAELWATGSVALDIRNKRMGRAPPRWTTQAPFQREDRCAPGTHRYSEALRFVQDMSCDSFGD